MLGRHFLSKFYAPPPLSLNSEISQDVSQHTAIPVLHFYKIRSQTKSTDFCLTDLSLTFRTLSVPHFTPILFLEKKISLFLSSMVFLNSKLWQLHLSNFLNSKTYNIIFCLFLPFSNPFYYPRILTDMIFSPKMQSNLFFFTMIML